MMNNRMLGLIFSVGVLCGSVPALAGQDGAQLSRKLLSRVIKGSQQVRTSMSQLPQNFGGSKRKLNVTEQAEISRIALGLASADEAHFQGVLRDVFQPLERMFRAGRVNLAGISDSSTRFIWKDSSSSVSRDKEGVLELRWGINAKSAGLSEADTSLNEYLGGFRKLDEFVLDPFSFSTPLSQRDPASALPLAYEVEARLDLRGLDLSKARRHDRGIVRLTVAWDAPSKRWKLGAWRLISGETLTASAPAFSEVSPFEPSAVSSFLRKEAIRRGGYALAVNDLDGDGWDDMVLGHLGALQVFKGSESGAFKLLDSKVIGLGEETLVKSAVMVDFNNDGRKDLLLTRFAPDEKAGNDIVLYQNSYQNSGDLRFKKVEQIRNRSPAYYAMPSAVGDFDADGLLDFYIGFPGAKDFTVLNRAKAGFSGSLERHPQGLFYNTGGLSFKEVTRERLPYTPKKNAYTDGYPEMAAVFPHASMAVDYNLDGNMDLVVIDDKANLSPLYVNDGKGTFSQVADKIGLTNYDFGMGFAAGDLSGRGKLDFIYTNVNFLPAERLHHGLSKNFSDFSKLAGTFGLRVFRSSDGRSYSDVSALTGVTGCGQGVAGVELIDYNNDGLLDIYVANGLWSGTTREQDLSSLFVRSYAKESFDFQEVLGSAQGVETANTSFMKILSGFEGDLETQSWKAGVRPSMAGYQRNCLFRNNGDDTFTEVGYLTGVDSLADGYVIATADLNRDGKMDLILRNGDPGVEEHRFSPVQVFMNQSPVASKSVILSFRGHKSNHQGIGVIAEAVVGGRKLVRHLVANSGAAQSETVLHFGLGELPAIDELTVRWPSGDVQKYKKIPAGRYMLEEGTARAQVAMK
jgi:ASPIC and UnbV/FG-GAP-like repeat